MFFFAKQIVLVKKTFFSTKQKKNFFLWWYCEPFLTAGTIVLGLIMSSCPYLRAALGG